MSARRHPVVVAVAGPNGAGKSTTAPALLHDVLGVEQFVNADDIARELDEPDPTRAALEAGGIMLKRLEKLAAQRENFAFETTLAARTPASWVRRWQRVGYEFHVLFFWLPGPELAINRVLERVRMGGHDVPERTIRERYRRGLRNFFRLYMPLTEAWRIYDNSVTGQPREIARGSRSMVELIVLPALWRRISQEHGNEHKG